MKFLFQVLYISGLFLTSLQLLPAQSPVVWSIRSDKSNIGAGERFNVEVSASIGGGWHVYSITQGAGGPIPTKISIDSQVFGINGIIKGPVPHRERDPNFNSITETYEGNANFTVPILVSPNIPNGYQTLNIIIRFQACNETTCLPPKTVKLVGSVEIVSKKVTGTVSSNNTAISSNLTINRKDPKITPLPTNVDGIGSLEDPAKSSISNLQTKISALEAKIESNRLRFGIPGLSLVIVQNGKIIYLKGLGYRNLEKKIPVTSGTLFPVGSLTKAFTALSVLMSQEQGKLFLNDSPKKFLPYFQLKNTQTENEIKIKDLLTHSSGIYRTDIGWLSGKLSREEIIRVTCQSEPVAKLYEKFLYQNVLYTAAGEIVSRVQKQSWETFVMQNILQPLKMNNSNFSLKDLQSSSNYSFGYEYNFDSKKSRRLPFRDVSKIAPAGGLNSSAVDLANWLNFILRNKFFNQKEIISESSFQEWMRPHQKISLNGSVNYGLGWFISGWKGLKIVQHGGNIDGFTSLMALIPEKNLGFVLMTNVSETNFGNWLMPEIWETFLEVSLTNDRVAEKNKPQIDELKSKTDLKSEALRELTGRYQMPDGRGMVEIRETETNITFRLPGEKPYVLVELSRDQFRLEPLPASYYLKVGRDETDKISKVVVIEPNGEFEFKRLGNIEDHKNNISVKELLSKTIDALGGVENWRKLKTRKIKYHLDLLNQGLSGEVVSLQKRPNLFLKTTRYFALNRKIASIQDYYDGDRGGQISSFSAAEIYSGQKLEDLKLENEFSNFLNWNLEPSQVEIIGMDKVGDEAVWVVVFHPHKANDITYYISAKSFLLLKKTSIIVSNISSAKLQKTQVYSDYRKIDGLLIPYQVMTVDPKLGDIITKVLSVRHNVNISEKNLKPMRKPH